MDADDGGHDAAFGDAHGNVGAKTMQRNRAMRITGLVAGYLAVWAVAGLPAYGLAWLAGWLTGTHPSAANVLAVAVFAVCARGRRRAGSCGGHHLAPLARPRPAGCRKDGLT